LLKARRPAIYRDQSLVELRRDPDERRQIEASVERFTQQVRAASLRDVFELADDLGVLEPSDDQNALPRPKTNEAEC
jgi:hypothetical protein